MQCDLGETMASVMATGSEVIGECVEGIRVEVRREVLRVVLVCPGFFRFGVQCLIGSVVRLR
jgi:nitrogenase molybdenum-iron protein alpha/beta subunit